MKVVQIKLRITSEWSDLWRERETRITISVPNFLPLLKLFYEEVTFFTKDISWHFCFVWNWMLKLCLQIFFFFSLSFLFCLLLLEMLTMFFCCFFVCKICCLYHRWLFTYFYGSLDKTVVSIVTLAKHNQKE